VLLFDKNRLQEQDKPEKEKTTPLSGSQDDNTQTNYIIIPPPSSDDENKLRVIGLVGDLDEEKASELMYGMLSLYQNGTKEIPKDPDNDKCEELIEIHKPFEFIISTHGGTTSDMFGIYDLMRKMQSDGCEVHTYGLGKVMSAGVLLLAAGTKGQRRIGANCRVMIHAIAGGSVGEIHSLETEMDEIRWVQDQYIRSLVKETAMSKKYLMNLLKKKVNVYISAQEAVDLGIADEVV
jgi:ATP-dependent Clp protease protease subunit